MRKAPSLCPLQEQCGGCQLQGTPYPEQLRLKQQRMEALLGGFGPVLPVIGMEQPLHYRNKLVRSFGLDARRRPVCGIYRQGSHALVPVENCLIEDEICSNLAKDLFSLLKELQIPVYDERSGSGFLRHILLRRAFATGELMVVLVAASPIFKRQKPFLKALLELHPEVKTVVLNQNDRYGPVVLGPSEKVLWGSGTIEDELGGLRFRISPRSFYQVNPVQTEKLYSAAIDLAGLSGRETVLDAYCGIGTIGLTAAGRAKQVAGVEINRDAVKDAIFNARRNGIKNCWFTAGDAGKFMEEAASEGAGPDVVFLDPPRSGSSRSFLLSLLKAAPKRIVYISCGPESLRRDLEMLTAGGYRMGTAQPVDMFPYTEHIECVAQLLRSR